MSLKIQYIHSQIRHAKSLNVTQNLPKFTHSLKFTQNYYLLYKFVTQNYQFSHKTANFYTKNYFTEIMFSFSFHNVIRDGRFIKFQDNIQIYSHK